ncbi:MAG: hypothetical protein FJ388_26315, partial [Verrucomicrobia bacterium]|nr:hypothetical protein [Verrucomicrobiota bacterium]
MTNDVGRAQERDGWTAAAPREEIRPSFSVSRKGGLVIQADEREGLSGCWTKTFPVQGGRHYRFHALRKATRVAVP